jgi:hypothetical protein
VVLVAVIGEREGGARGQREAMGGGSLWAPAGKQRRRWCHGSDKLHVVCACGRQLVLELIILNNFSHLIHFQFPT